MLNSFPRRLGVARFAVLSCAVVACSSDTVCPPCAEPLAASISVSAANAPNGIVGMTMSWTGPSTGNGSCQGSGPTVLCDILGGPGDYHVTLNAPGYQANAFTVSVPGTVEGCGCAKVTRQNVSVVMQPSATPS
jgi:hypothetical protein